MTDGYQRNLYLFTQTSLRQSLRQKRKPVLRKKKPKEIRLTQQPRRLQRTVRQLLSLLVEQHILSEVQDLDRQLQTMDFSSLEILTYTAVHLLQTVPTVQDLQWEYIRTLVYHFHTHPVHSEASVMRLVLLLRLSLVISSVTQVTLLSTSAADRLYMLLRLRQVSRFHQLHTVRFLQ